MLLFILTFPNLFHICRLAFEVIPLMLSSLFQTYFVLYIRENDGVLRLLPSQTHILDCLIDSLCDVLETNACSKPEFGMNIVSCLRSALQSSFRIAANTPFDLESHEKAKSIDTVEHVDLSRAYAESQTRSTNPRDRVTLRSRAEAAIRGFMFKNGRGLTQPTAENRDRAISLTSEISEGPAQQIFSEHIVNRRSSVFDQGLSENGSQMDFESTQKSILDSFVEDSLTNSQFFDLARKKLYQQALDPQSSNIPSIENIVEQERQTFVIFLMFDFI